jgi:uncharacterized protein YndB with AHSA1/START domain
MTIGQREERQGVIERDGGHFAVRLERDLDAPPAEVWQLLTEPAELKSWLLATAEIEPRAGGAIDLHFANTGTTICGHVLRYEPPHIFEFTWQSADEPESVVRFALAGGPAGGTRLTLTHARCDGGEAGLFAAGWHHHFELLAARTGGRPAAWDWARFEELRAGYGTAEGGR